MGAAALAVLLQEVGWTGYFQTIGFSGVAAPTHVLLISSSKP